MTLSLKFKALEKLAIDNSPVLLTAIGVIGTIGTAVLTHRAALRAEAVVEYEIDRRAGQADPVPWSRKEHAKLVWKYYTPPVVSGALTIGAIVGANRIGSRRAAAMAAAFTITEKAYTEYREKVVEKLGEGKERAIRDEISQDRVNRTPGSTEVILAGTEVLCFDEFTGRYFKSDMQALRTAENDINRKLLHEGYATLSDFYDRVGLPATDASEEVGWSSDKRLEVEFSTTLSEDGRPCLSVNFSVAPNRDYRNFH